MAKQSATEFIGALSVPNFTTAQRDALVSPKNGTIVYNTTTAVLNKYENGLWSVFGGASPVQSVAGKTGIVTLDKSDVGLNNVDNTSDANKPVSTAQATANTADRNRANHTGTQLAATISDLSKSSVGLGSVDNTSDLNKPVSTSQATINATKAQIGGDLSGTITAPTVKSRMSVTVGSSNADYITDGVADQVQILQAYNAVGQAGGGIVYIRPGLYDIAAEMVFIYSNVTIIGSGKQSTVLRCSYDGSGGTANSNNGIMAFRHTNGTSAVSNINVKDLSIDLNSFATNGIHIKGATSTTAESKEYLFEDMEIYGRGKDNTGSVGAIKITADYSSTMGLVNNVTFSRVTIRDGVPSDVNNQTTISVLILANSLSNLTFDRCTFYNVYGNTIKSISTAKLRARKNWQFTNNDFTKTMQLGYATGLADYSDSGRKGYDGIKFIGNHYDQSGNDWSTFPYDLQQAPSHVNVYNAQGFVFSNNYCYKSPCVLAPGGPAEAGESQGSVISNNMFYEIHHFADADANYATVIDSNTFYKTEWGAVLGGYGRHYPSQYSNNLFYNCVLNPQLDIPQHQALFNIQDGGNIIEGNTIYDDTASTKLSYIFAETGAGGNTTNPNVYRNNTILGTGAGISTFYLNSFYKHIIQNNSGIKESTIQKSATGGTAVNTPLNSNDIATGNFTNTLAKISDWPVLDIASGGTGSSTGAGALAAIGGVNKTGDSMTGNLSIGTGYAASFAGTTTSFIDEGNNPALNLGTAFTIQTTFQLASDYDASVERWMMTKVSGYWFKIGTNLKLQGSVWGGTAVAGNTTLVRGVTYNALFTYDGTTANLYLNGALDGSAASTSTVAAGNNLFLGKRNGQTGNEFKGTLDNVRAWTRVLSGAEITSVSAGSPASTTNLVLEQGFDEQSLLDTSPTANTLSLNTGVTYVSPIAPLIYPSGVNLYNLFGGAKFVGPVTSPSLTTDRLNDSTGVQQIGFLPTAGAVNYLNVSNALAGGSVYIQGAGTDTNVPTGVRSKGSGNVFLQPGANSTQGIRFMNATGTVLGSVDTSNTRFMFGASTAATSTLQSGGSFSLPIRTSTTSTSLGVNDATVLMNTTSGNLTATLPTAVGATGRRYDIKKISTDANTLTIATTASQTIDGTATLATTATTRPSYTFQSDGANWWLV